jgi:hypothetical protein
MGQFDWAFTIGNRIKIRLVDEVDSDHPMHHPFSLGPTMAAGVSNSVSDAYASVCANSHPCISSLSLPSSSAIGKQITDVVTPGGQSSTNFVLRTIGASSRRARFAVPVTLTVS